MSIMNIIISNSKYYTCTSVVKQSKTFSILCFHTVVQKYYNQTYPTSTFLVVRVRHLNALSLYEYSVSHWVYFKLGTIININRLIVTILMKHLNVNTNFLLTFNSSKHNESTLMNF